MTVLAEGGTKEKRRYGRQSERTSGSRPADGIPRTKQRKSYSKLIIPVLEVRAHFRRGPDMGQKERECSRVDTNEKKGKEFVEEKPLAASRQEKNRRNQGTAQSQL